MAPCSTAVVPIPSGGRVARWLPPLLYIEAIIPLGNNCRPQVFKSDLNSWRAHMPILLWLIGVPISIIVLLMLFGVLHI